MQIFRVSADHQVSARFLDNRRLSKQVLELYQIIRVCLAEMGVIEGNTRYLSHPIVKHVYHEGTPYLADTMALLEAMNAEHLRRGGKRSDAFREDLERLRKIVSQVAHLNPDPLPPFYVYGDDKVVGEDAYVCYEALLFQKWQADKIAPRCGWRGV
ncbi:pyrimidine dimer DNA glycosylase/endonuclease V [Staphylococcus canis]|uniref:Pyrimidine dimer DNA glycosylase n=1 Tax=Staphylococcus canis TaxID=2724942 RepID=A0ABS0TB51_9STAP|nr:pyrimidine dimer DNA glycosylase/endonuclease V [Staphylococcus canis]MBI5975974.1 hypothetical protein [Staphylococcus canis]